MHFKAKSVLAKHNPLAGRLSLQIADRYQASNTFQVMQINTGSTVILSITLYPQQNKVHFADGEDQGCKHAEVGRAVHQFKHRWECQVLSLLWLEGQVGHPLIDTVLQQSLRQKGQAKDLNRAQLQRLFAALNEFLSLLPGRPLRLHTAPRQATVGPWALICTAPVRFHDGQAKPPAQTGPALWPYPLLLRPKNAGQGGLESTCVDTLHQLLSLLLIADSFSINGDYADAIETLQAVYRLPLTAEAACLVWLREAQWQKRLGRFDAARHLAGQVLANPPPLDPAQLSCARFWLQRIDYDESPAENHASLWHSVTPPSAMQGADGRVLPDWHNLRALLARRRLLDLPRAHARAQAGEVGPDSPAALHECALNHFQSALYWVLQQRDWDRLLAYVANVGFHLQSVLPLGLASVSQVFAWHGLCLTYGDKFNLAQDSAWEFIFLGEFWLDHHAELAARSLATPLTHTVDDAHPSQQAFYTKALDKLKKCADARQYVIMWILYGRFVACHLLPSIPTQAQSAAKAVLAASIQDAIAALLDSHPKLLKALREEGYAAWLPAGPAPSRRQAVKRGV
jgi:tetratricopeptide (TPR) repeat protein